MVLTSRLVDDSFGALGSHQLREAAAQRKPRFPASIFGRNPKRNVALKNDFMSKAQPAPRLVRFASLRGVSYRS